MHLVNLDGFISHRCCQASSPMGLYFVLVFIFYTEENFTIFTFLWYKEPRGIFHNFCSHYVAILTALSYF